MGSSGGATKGSSSSTNEIAPELRPLFDKTAGMVSGMQSDIAPQFGGDNGFFSSNPQFIPGFTDVGNAMAQNQIDRFNQYSQNPYTNAEQSALSGMQAFTNGPLGSAPATIAAMNAVRTPVMNDLALSGMGNSDAVGSNLAGAYAPILAQEMQARQSLLPQMAQLGNVGFQRQQGLASDVANTQEQYRGIEEARGKADLNDFLRRQNLGSQFTTGILGGFPALGGSVSTSKQSGGGGK